MPNDFEKNPLRTSVRISEEIFKQKVMEFVSSASAYLDGFVPYKRFEDAPDAVSVNERTKYDLDLLLFKSPSGRDECYGLENAMITPEECWSEFTDANSLIGIHTLDNGLTFLGCAGGDDGDEIGTFFIIYYDGLQICAYMPKSGVAYNKKVMTLWGLELERQVQSRTMDNLYDKNQLIEEFPNKAKEINKLFECYDEVDEEIHTNIYKLILKWYGDERKPFFDWHKIEADIKNTIRIVG